MSIIPKIAASLIAGSLIIATLPAKGQSASLLQRPVAAKGAVAKTLVVYSETRAPYSLADDLAALKLQLRRVAGQLETVAATQADPAKLAVADYLVIFCPQPFPALSAPLLEAIARSSAPVLWVGYGADQLTHLPQFAGQFDIAPFAATQPIETVTYQGREWKLPLTGWLPALLNPTIHPAAPIISVTTVTNNETTIHPVSWKSGPVTFFVAPPNSPANSPLFSDLLLDFYGVEKASAAATAVRIDGYHCHQDHLEFRRLVDTLHQRGLPFTVGVIPAYCNPETKKIEELDSQPEFIAALRYAQSRGGRLLLQGYVNTRKASTGQEPEFWNATLDRPVADDGPEYVRERLRQGIRQMLKRGLFPLGWITPFNSASRADYAEIANHFSTASERVQLSDATAAENFAGTAIIQDDFGRLIIPENLGTITGQKAALIQLQARAELQTRLRSTVSQFSFPAYLTDDKLSQAVRLLDQLKTPFLDLADGDHWVQLPEALLLTGNAQRTVKLRDARVTWKAFDRTGKLLEEATEPEPATGQRLFQRRGKGDYELFLIIEAKP